MLDEEEGQIVEKLKASLIQNRALMFLPRSSFLYFLFSRYIYHPFPFKIAISLSLSLSLCCVLFCSSLLLSSLCSYFGPRNLSLTGTRAFQEQTYLCMLAQGLQRKADVESWLSTNIFIVLMWQLGEIWPTGGWWATKKTNERRRGRKRRKRRRTEATCRLLRHCFFPRGSLEYGQPNAKACQQK